MKICPGNDFDGPLVLDVDFALAGGFALPFGLDTGFGFGLVEGAT